MCSNVNFPFFPVFCSNKGRFNLRQAVRCRIDDHFRIVLRVLQMFHFHFPFLSYKLEFTVLIKIVPGFLRDDILMQPFYLSLITHHLSQFDSGMRLRKRNGSHQPIHWLTGNSNLRCQMPFSHLAYLELQRLHGCRIKNRRSWEEFSGSACSINWNLGLTKILSYIPLSSSIISNYKSNCYNQQNKCR